MEPGTKAFFAREGGNFLSNLVKLGLSRPRKPTTDPESQKEGTPEEIKTSTTQEPKEAPQSSYTSVSPGTVATACIPCALGHFSTSAGLLNEATRFKGEGITSNEVADRIAKVLEELNTMERVDLTPEKIINTPDGERDLAEEALTQSRSLRHRLESIQSIEDLELAAADTSSYYRILFREWWKRRFAKTGEAGMTLDEAKKMAAEEAAKAVGERWPK